MSASQSSAVDLEIDNFGEYTDKSRTIQVNRFTWRNSNDISVAVITYGATITSIKMPDKDGKTEDIVLGYKDMEGYLNPLNPYFGATVGRVANRIANSAFTIEGVSYNVSTNHGKHTLHGGFRGFDKVTWNHHITNDRKVVLSYISPDGEEGFPGDVITNVTFKLTEDNKFIIDYKAVTTKPTYVNLTNHSYFNLAGHSKGADEIYKHVITINGDYITEVNEEGIPTGNLSKVCNTVFDLRVPRVLGDVLHSVPGNGYDHNFCVSKASEQETAFVARALHPDSGRILEVYSNQPGVQFYTANFFPHDPRGYKSEPKGFETLFGKSSCNYYKHGAFCFETQNYPDAINHDRFPKAVLYPGEIYHHITVLKLSLYT